MQIHMYSKVHTCTIVHSYTRVTVYKIIMCNMNSRKSNMHVFKCCYGNMFKMLYVYGKEKHCYKSVYYIKVHFLHSLLNTFCLENFIFKAKFNK